MYKFDLMYHKKLNMSLLIDQRLENVVKRLVYVKGGQLEKLLVLHNLG